VNFEKKMKTMRNQEEKIVRIRSLQRIRGGIAAFTSAALTAVLLVHSSPISAAMGDEPPLMRPEDRMTLDRQAEELAGAASPVTEAVGRSMVWVYRGRRQVALGTVIGDGTKVLTKWSEATGGRGPLICVTADGKSLNADLAGGYPGDDIALLSLRGGKLPPVHWSSAATPPPGSFLVAVLPGGGAAAIGVVSVTERSLRETDQAFLGILLDPKYEGPGVKVASIVEDSGAVVAGLRPGDVILRVGERRLSGLFELRTALVGLQPGDTAKLWISRAGEESEVKVKLGSRPEFPQIPPARLKAMENMAGEHGISRVGDGFPEVVQSAMKIWPELCGGPAVSLDGRIAGIVIARGTRTRSFVIPTARVMEVLKQNPVTPPSIGRASIARASAPPRARPVPGPPRPRMVPAPRRRLQPERINELEEFMNRFRRELNALEDQ
jgi:S1-C subfamily serine protease